jgi:hypothetical protein
MTIMLVWQGEVGDELYATVLLNDDDAAAFRERFTTANHAGRFTLDERPNDAPIDVLYGVAMENTEALVDAAEQRAEEGGR